MPLQEFTHLQTQPTSQSNKYPKATRNMPRHFQALAKSLSHHFVRSGNDGRSATARLDIAEDWQYDDRLPYSTTVSTQKVSRCLVVVNSRTCWVDPTRWPWKCAPSMCQPSTMKQTTNRSVRPNSRSERCPWMARCGEDCFGWLPGGAQSLAAACAGYVCNHMQSLRNTPRDLSWWESLCTYPWLALR